MKILVYGVGGVGGYFGGRLADAGHEVSMIARGSHLEAIQKNGLEVQSIKGNFMVFPKFATDNPAEVETPDLVIFATKSWQLGEAAGSLVSVVGRETMFLPLQNGASNVEILKEILPERNVLGGLCHIISFIDAPGRIKHTSMEPNITFGELDGSKTPRIEKLRQVFTEAGIKNSISDDIKVEIWAKFLYITTVSGIGGLTRVPIDKIRQSEYLLDIMKKTAEEIKAVANAKGIALKQNHLDKTFNIIKNQAEGTTASAQRDIMSGRPSELETFNGYVVKEGDKLEVSTPVNRFIYECLLPMEHIARKR